MMEKKGKFVFIFDVILALLISFFVVGLLSKVVESDGILVATFAVIVVPLVFYSWKNRHSKNATVTVEQPPATPQPMKKVSYAESEIIAPPKKEFITTIPFPVGDFKKLESTLR